MDDLLKIGETKDIPPGSCKAIEIQGKAIAVFNIGGVFYAIDDTCTHSGGPLSEGDIDGTQVTCPWHSAKFDVTSGEVLCEPADEPVKCYRVQVVGDDILLEIEGQ